MHSVLVTGASRGIGLEFVRAVAPPSRATEGMCSLDAERPKKAKVRRLHVYRCTWRVLRWGKSTFFCFVRGND